MRGRRHNSQANRKHPMPVSKASAAIPGMCNSARKVDGDLPVVAPPVGDITQVEQRRALGPGTAELRRDSARDSS
jgi:hypothetical protein